MTTSSRVMLITAPLAPHWLERFQSAAPELHVKQRQPQEMERALEELWQDVEILYTSFATSLPTPQQAPRLRWVQLYSAGPDHILSHPLFTSSTVFTTTSGIHALPIAEYVLAMTLAWFHRLQRIFAWQQQHAWPAAAERIPLFAGEELHGKTMGIVGYGSIGREVARLATAFGMRILAMQRGSNHQEAGFALPNAGDPSGVIPACFYTPGELHTMLQMCDVVVIALPLTSKTRGMFDDTAFQAMKQTALLVNIARGDICNEAALLRALQEKRIAGAILDVFQQEPLPPEHPLWQLPDVFISPHCSSLTPHYEERAARVCLENVRRYLAGEQLWNIVDKDEGY